MPSMPVWRRLRAVPAHVLGNLPKPSAKFGRFGLEVGGFLAALGQGRQVPLNVAPPREDLLGHLTVWHLTPSARDGWTSRIRLGRARSTALVPDGAIASAGMRCASCSRPATGSGIVGHGSDVPARRTRARRGAALREFTAEHGERALRELGGRRAAERLLEREDAAASVTELLEALEAAR